MNCITCGSKTTVANTYALQGLVIRNRKCPKCNKYFFTKEEVADINVHEVIKNGLTNTGSKKD